MCGAPLLASGRDPSGGHAESSFASLRPERQEMRGPPMLSIATPPASVYKSAYVMPDSGSANQKQQRAEHPHGTKRHEWTARLRELLHR